MQEGYAEKGVVAYLMGHDEKCSEKIRLRLEKYDDDSKNKYFVVERDEIDAKKKSDSDLHCVIHSGECSATLPIQHFQYNGNGELVDDRYIAGDQIAVADYVHIKTLCYAWPAVCEVNQLRNIEHIKILPIYEHLGSVKVYETVAISCIGKRYPNLGTEWWKPSKTVMCIVTDLNSIGWDPTPSQLQCSAACDEPTVKNGQINGYTANAIGKANAGTNVTVNCNKGFRLNSGSLTTFLTCRETDSQWFPDVTCENLKAVPHSKISGFAVGDTVLYAQTVNFKCDGSRYPNDGSIWYSDSKSVKCNGPALWENITCTAACDLPKLKNGKVTGYKTNNINKVKSGTTATTTCNDGYKLSNDLDSVTMTCKETDSQWHPSFTCKPICYVKELESITYSKTNAGGLTTVNVGEGIHFECTQPRYPNVIDAWWLTKKIQCLASDKWEHNMKCSVACDKPILKHGQLGKYPLNAIFKVNAGTNVEVNCDYKFELSNGVDTQTLTCQENDGKWSPNVTCEPRCKLQCINGGTCLENPMNGANKCACPIGFTGTLCEIEITGGTHTKELLEIRDQTAVMTTVADMEPYVTGHMTYTECQHNNFTHTGSCYTINYDPNNVTIVNKAGRQQGLRLILFNNETEFVGYAIQSGMKLIIHKQGERVFPENQGRFLSPGFHPLIAMKYSETKRDERKCASEEFLKTIDYFYDGDYTLEGCLKTCYQKKVIAACGCGDPRAALDPKNKQLAYCSVQERNCVNNVGDITSADKCTCPEPCSISLYEPTYSSGKWPAKNYIVPFCEKIVRKSIWRKEDLKRCNEAYRNSHAKIDIYYKQLDYQVWTEYPAYTLANLWSDFGNLLDVFFGVGYIWFFEVAQIVWHMVYVTIVIKFIFYYRRFFANNVNPAEQ